VGDLLAVAVVVGALAEPRGEDGLDGQVQLLVRIVREVAADGVADDLLVGGDEGLEVRDVEVGVLGVLAVASLAASRASSKRLYRRASRPALSERVGTSSTIRPNMLMKRR